LIVPTFLKGTLAVSGQGLAALTILVSAILAWPVYSPFLSIVVGMSLVMFKGGNSDIFITDLMAGKLAAISTGMIGFGASAMVLLWILLARLNGQTSINRLGPGNVRFRQSMTMNPRNERPGKIGSFIEGLMEKISGIPSPFVFHQNDSRARVRQRRVVTAGITPPWFTGASYVLLFTAVILFVDAAVFLGTGYSLPSQVLRGMCLMLILVEPWFFAIALTQRWPLLARESLLPASRAEFAFETGWASFQDLLESWVTCTTVALLIIFAWSPEDFIRQIGDIGWVIIYAAAALIFVFGISIWFMRFRHRWVSFLGLMLCLPIVTVPVLITFGREPRNAFHLDRTVAAISILGLCLTGMLLIVDAYHRWYRTELD
jgi:hypothetical protein